MTNTAPTPQAPPAVVSSRIAPSFLGLVVVGAAVSVALGVYGRIHVPTGESTVLATAETTLGQALVDAAGLTMYGFLNDTNGVPTCDDACPDAWPPLTLPADALPDGLDPEVFSVVSRTDGTFQLKAGVWPL